MKYIYCLYCGNNLEVSENQKSIVCKNCRNEYTLNIKNKDELQFLVTACEYYQNNDFEKAENYFEKISNSNLSNSYACWGCFLAYTHSKFYYNNKGDICVKTDRTFNGELYANYFYRQALSMASNREKDTYIKLCTMINNYNKDLKTTNNISNNDIKNESNCIDKDNGSLVEKNTNENTAKITIDNNNSNINKYDKSYFENINQNINIDNQNKTSNIENLDDNDSTIIEKMYSENIKLYNNALNKREFLISIDFFKSNINYRDCKKYLDIYKDEWNKRLFDLGEIINKYFIKDLLISKLGIIQKQIDKLNEKLLFFKKNEEKESIYKNEKNKINSKIEEIKSELEKTSSFNFGKKSKLEKEKNSLVSIATIIEIKIKECTKNIDLNLEVDSKRKLAELVKEKEKVSTLIHNCSITPCDKEILDKPKYISVFNDYISSEDDLYIFARSPLLDIICKNEDVIYRIASNEKLLEILHSTPKLLSLLPQEIQLSVCKKLVLGRYKQNLNQEETPIVWQVIKETDKYFYLMSEKILDIKPYNEHSKDNLWNNSTLNLWLNDSFLNKAFNEIEKNKLQNVNVRLKDDNINLKSFDFTQSIDSIEEDLKADYQNLSTKNDTTNINTENENFIFDKIILVSFKNFINLSQQDKIASVTEYVKSMYKTENNIEWWVRKQKSSNKDNSIILADTSGRYTENYYNFDKLAGVRPCICIKK